MGLGLTLFAAILISSSCSTDRSAPVASIRFGINKSEVNALVVIAQERGYFAANGVEVIQHTYPSGVAALDALLDEEIDIAAASEFAFVRRVLAGENVRALTVINRSSIEYVVARIDRGIRTIDDLHGKTIGAPLGSRPEFALDRFLYFRGIDATEVTLVHVPVDQSVDALVDGEVDAVAAWQPYIDEIREIMGGDVVVWSAQEDQPSYTLLASRGEWTADNAQHVTRFLRALAEAETWVAANPDAARQFIQEKWGYSEAYMASAWPDHAYGLLLDQTLIVAMEDQARWIIERELAGQVETPNFLHYIYFDGLEAVKPEAVNVIR
ncbi:MAG TPA: ABC transporter substrate-binding protein [Anaerolineae bacterium]|nr:ABC transporter substrate-binding protein [Anaerolineae bacterium]